MMKDDPAIEKIRSVRRRISEEFGNDPARLIAHYIEYQKEFADRLIGTSPPEQPSQDPDAAEPANAGDRP